MTLNPNPQHCPCLHFSYITCRVIAVQAASVQVSSFFSPPQTQAGSASLFHTLRNPSRMLPFCATKPTHCATNPLAKSACWSVASDPGFTTGQVPPAGVSCSGSLGYVPGLIPSLPHCSTQGSPEAGIQRARW